MVLPANPQPKRRLASPLPHLPVEMWYKIISSLSWKDLQMWWRANEAEFNAQAQLLSLLQPSNAEKDAQRQPSLLPTLSDAERDELKDLFAATERKRAVFARALQKKADEIFQSIRLDVHNHLVITTNVSVFYYGGHHNGSLVLGHNNEVITLTQLDLNPPLAPNAVIAHVAAGMNSTVFVVQIGGSQTVYVYGSNQWGQLGLGNNTDVKIPATRLDLDLEHNAVITHVVGRAHTVFVVKAGGSQTVYACGYNHHGQLGLGHDADVNRLTELENPDWLTVPNAVITHVAAGISNTFFVVEAVGSQKVYGCGGNKYGQLGLGHNIDVNRPTRLENPDWLTVPNAVITHIVIGNQHTVFLVNVGGLQKVYGCGSNEYGQLGLGLGHNRSVNRPTELENPDWLKVPNAVITHLAAGEAHTVFVVKVGRLQMVYGCGSNHQGQLGLGHNADVNRPTRLENPPWGRDAVITHVAAGGNSTVFVANSRVYFCGQSFTSLQQYYNTTNTNTPILKDGFSLVFYELTARFGYAAGQLVAQMLNTELEQTKMALAKYVSSFFTDCSDKSENYIELAQDLILIFSLATSTEFEKIFTRIMEIANIATPGQHIYLSRLLKKALLLFRGDRSFTALTPRDIARMLAYIPVDKIGKVRVILERKAVPTHKAQAIAALELLKFRHELPMLSMIPMILTEDSNNTLINAMSLSPDKIKWVVKSLSQFAPECFGPKDTFLKLFKAIVY